MTNIILDHIDIVVTHSCNMSCPFCIDKFRGMSDNVIKMPDVERFLQMIRNHTNEPLEVLLLGGDPTTIGAYNLINISKICHKYGFKVIMSTNGLLKGTVIDCLPYFDSIQITVHNDKEIDYWREFKDKINVKLAGDENLNWDKLIHFMEYTEGFSRRSVSMYFTPDFEELCNDKKIWNLLDTLNWKRNGSYEYAFYNGVRFKKGIHGETNIIDEPTVPKLYPNGNYNKTWNNEHMDDYLNFQRVKML